MSEGKTAEPDSALVAKFSEALDEDLNVSAAWGAIFDWVRDTNKTLASNAISSQQAATALAAWNKIDSVLGLGAAREETTPPESQKLLEERQ